LNEVKSLVLSILKRSKNADVSNLSDELLEAYLLLIEQEVTEEISKEIIHKIHNNLKGDEVSDRVAIKNCLTESIMRMVRHVEPITLCEGRAKKVAFVGPTGVGKTTTIAKLAAEFSLKEKKDVALITIDTYRIAAVEQLRTYADIINIPLEVVLSPSEVQHALEKHRDRDLILIDTAGRSHKNAMQMLELQSFIETIDPDETHLVLSTTVTFKSVQEILDRFKSISIDKLVFTKLDEAVSLGLILNVMSKLNKTLSYVTTGQNVPDDISVTDPEMLANLIIAGETA
jgi:flagellar biosynthesis protein FlhF